jgi:High potential iron-sulfur protein
MYAPNKIDTDVSIAFSIASGGRNGDKAVHRADTRVAFNLIWSVLHDYLTTHRTLLIERYRYIVKSAKPAANCANCSQFQAKAGDAMGPCAIFPGKSVASAGWCTGWVKKAAASHAARCTKLYDVVALCRGRSVDQSGI